MLLSLAACDEPSTVGADLIEGEGGTPEAMVVRLSAAQDTTAPITGNAQRILAGTVDDPLLGTITATGYLDFQAASSVDSTFRNNDLRLVFLDLIIDDYAYGDTTGTLTLRLRGMPAEWEAEGATADTSLIADSPITTFTFTADDSLVTVQLPQRWVDAHESELLSGNFTDAFHGLQLEPRSGEAVVGFSGSQTRLRAIAGDDTARYVVSKTLTTIQRTGAEALPPNRQVIQDGTGLTARITVADSAALPSGPLTLNHAALHLAVDTETLDGAPNFFRPQLDRLRFYGVREGEDTPSRVPLFDFQRTEEDGYVAVSIGNGPPDGIIRQIFKQRIQENANFERFLIAPVPRIRSDGGAQLVNALNVALIYSGDAPTTCGPDGSSPCAPRIDLVYTPVD